MILFWLIKKWHNYYSHKSLLFSMRIKLTIAKHVEHLYLEIELVYQYSVVAWKLFSQTDAQMSQGQQKTFLGILWRHYQREVLAKLTYGMHFNFCFWGFLGDKCFDLLNRLAPSLDVIRKNKVIVAAEKELLRLRLVLYEEVGRIKRFGKLFFGHDVRIIGRLLTNRTKHLDSPLEQYFISVAI